MVDVLKVLSDLVIHKVYMLRSIVLTAKLLVVACLDKNIA
jgi:hypothetical protein